MEPATAFCLWPDTKSDILGPVSETPSIPPTEQPNPLTNFAGGETGCRGKVLGDLISLYAVVSLGSLTAVF
jgi:hypothetical protein